jgi:hypothetical protein
VNNYWPSTVLVVVSDVYTKLLFSSGTLLFMLVFSIPSPF